MKKIGVVGQGFVGSSLKEGFKDVFDVLTYDKYISEKSNSTLEEIVKECDVIFSCVPTPMDMNTGMASVEIVIDVVRNINTAAEIAGTSPVIVVKSTVPPGTSAMLGAQHSHICPVAFNPEFLTEANAVEDFKNQNRIVVGADNDKVANRVKSVFEKGFPNVPILKTSTHQAEMVKYVTNCFLATKVSFANEIFDLCKTMGMNYDEVIDLAKLDTRLGDSHWMVPGPDGDRGYGGHCFPKDLQALRYVASRLNVKTHVLDGANMTNNRVRANRDWEGMEGRAVINSKKVDPITGNVEITQ